MAESEHSPTGNVGKTTVLFPYGCNDNSCGYCNVPIGNKSYMMMAGVDRPADGFLGITPNDYKSLLDRGWRRSGNIIYKPDMRGSCCQEYTIRLKSSTFKANSKQRKAVNAWSNYILGIDYKREQARKYPITRQEKREKRLASFDIVGKVHEPELDFLKAKNPLEPAHKFRVVLENGIFTEEKYALFEHYQKQVHNDVATESGFKRFLCANPFKPPYSVDSKGRKIGAYHQCYYLNDRLIAMAVLDLLPDCVSGVYFMYHTDFSQWSFGKLSAIREIALAEELGYEYYYMGYYIHSCPKMRYKCEYQPAQVLDPECYDWHTFDNAFRSILDSRPYYSPSLERILTAEGSSTSMALLDTYYVKKQQDSKFAAYETVFTTDMSGVVKLEDIEPVISDTRILVGSRLAVAEMLLHWEDMDINVPVNVKHKIAEVIATIGIELASRVIVCLALGK
ncbi:Arginyl-tRNA--protein transferase 1 [Orbilia blumenaviensis]|uniref:Arginyl-tRNA--protein transferase 1 n=1 Tax=Orbilia blumenaviensis TaxID=1796055 RepID=A0AAV9VGH7_9PEZI